MDNMLLAAALARYVLPWLSQLCSLISASGGSNDTSLAGLLWNEESQLASLCALVKTHPSKQILAQGIQQVVSSQTYQSAPENWLCALHKQFCDPDDITLSRQVSSLA